MGASWEVFASVSQIYLPSSSGSPCPDVRVLYHIIIIISSYLPLVEEGNFLLDIVKKNSKAGFIIYFLLVKGKLSFKKQKLDFIYLYHLNKISI